MEGCLCSVDEDGCRLCEAVQEVRAVFMVDYWLLAGAQGVLG